MPGELADITSGPWENSDQVLLLSQTSLSVCDEAQHDKEQTVAIGIESAIIRSDATLLYSVPSPLVTKQTIKYLLRRFWGKGKRVCRQNSRTMTQEQSNFLIQGFLSFLLPFPLPPTHSYSNSISSYYLKVLPWVPREQRYLHPSLFTRTPPDRRTISADRHTSQSHTHSHVGTRRRKGKKRLGGVKMCPAARGRPAFSKPWRSKGKQSTCS